jgi:hypothetical protein
MIDSGAGGVGDEYQAVSVYSTYVKLFWLSATIGN